MEKRRKAADDMKASRSKTALSDSNSQVTGDASVLDNLLEKLRNGDSVGRKSRRNRQAPGGRAAMPMTLDINTANGAGHEDAPSPSALGVIGDDTADLARDMLARLKSDGFVTPNSPRTERSSARRPRRRRGSDAMMNGIAEKKSPEDLSSLDATEEPRQPESSLLPVSPVEEGPKHEL